MIDTIVLPFDQPEVSVELDNMSAAELDQLDFGVIGFDATTIVTRYNAFEVRAAGLTAAGVLGRPLFTVVAPCMNNYLVAQRFEDAVVGGTALDVVLPYVLTLRMRPEKVALRIVARAGAATRYVLVQRRV